jgi:hypothetical protein
MRSGKAENSEKKAIYTGKQSKAKQKQKQKPSDQRTCWKRE